MATYDISLIGNSIQITRDTNVETQNIGFYGISDPSTDSILYLTREGSTKYKIDTSADTITIDSVAFVGDSHDLRDTLTQFFF